MRRDIHARVRRFLAMPANASLGAALRETQRFHSAYFSAAAFLIQANAHGGELYFEEDLVNQMLDNTMSTGSRRSLGTFHSA
jgi:hypothetical protein